MVELTPASLRIAFVVVLTILNYFIWYGLGKQLSTKAPCKSFQKQALHSDGSLDLSAPCLFQPVCETPLREELPKLMPILTKGLVSYKSDSLINIRYPEWSILMQQQGSKGCERIVNPHITRKRQFACLAVVAAESDNTYNLLRYEVNRVGNESFESESGPTPAPTVLKVTKKKAKKIKPKALSPITPEVSVAAFNSTGFFENVANDKGRIKLRKKMTQFLAGLPSLESHLKQLLDSRGLQPGSDVVVMVVNTGEIDLLANFVCSCAMHNISVHNVIVFAGSDDIIPVLESFGVIGVYHEASFASVSKEANREYLDPIFIDMMWYKSFSVWLLLKMRFHVLFQDVDIVWFRTPFQYFHDVAKRYKQPTATTTVDGPGQLTESNGGGGRGFANKVFTNLRQRTHDLLNSGSGAASSNSFHSGEVGVTDHRNIPPPDAYLSDDGQRSLRYTPFFANSGFYYLVANERTENFAWGILSAFDLLHITGSHQNVFTVRLMEGLDLSALRVKLLTLREFPSGVKFNHDKPFMRAIRDGHETPYMFHMCWTLNKYDKLRNFRASAMWYVREEYSEELGTFHRPSTAESAEEGVDSGDALLVEGAEGVGAVSGAGKEKTLMLMAEQFQLENMPHRDRWKIMAKTICQKPLV